MMISFRQERKFYSMSAVIRNRKIRNLFHKLIKLKPYIKVFFSQFLHFYANKLENYHFYPGNFQGSDRAYDVVSHLKRTSEIPPELSKYVAQSVEASISCVHKIL